MHEWTQMEVDAMVPLVTCSVGLLGGKGSERKPIPDLLALGVTRGGGVLCFRHIPFPLLFFFSSFLRPTINRYNLLLSLLL